MKLRIAHAAFAPLLALLLAPASARTADAPVAWPDTDPARHARAWFDAFAGDEAAMRAWWAAHGSAAALARRPVEPRLDVWRDMRDRFRTLEPVRVVESRPDLIRVSARTGAGGTVAIGFPCEPDPPHGVVSIGVEDGDPGPGAPPPPADEGPPPTESQIAAALLSQADSLARVGLFSGAVLLEKDGTTLATRAYGLASRAAHRPNTLETQLNLGSINKIFTHVAIEQLAQKGALSLDDPVTRYLDDYRVANAGKITIRMLLEHRGGVPDVLENPDLAADPARVKSMEDWYALVRGMPLRFEPGTKQEYSNGGFVLLGEVIARVSGEDYYAYVAKHVYAPAGMTATGHFPLAEKSAGRAECYTMHRADADEPHTGEGPWACTDHGLGLGSSAGGGWSTVSDLARFARALRGGALLDSAHTAAMLGEPAQLGIAGGSPGVNALLVISGPYTLVALANLDPPAAEQFARSTGHQLRRLTGAAPGPRVGGGR